ncbi:hypothetical protein [Nocardia araoensis]|uniref:hypothetical protein n=1 Tax=Nocardia araoensis TaxID=228600 RepID=UPI0012F686B0|nr:hypothetical protein [Nocardia araoensis]
MWVDKTEESRVIGHFVDSMLKLRHAVVLPGLISISTGLPSLSLPGGRAGCRGV